MEKTEKQSTFSPVGLQATDFLPQLIVHENSPENKQEYESFSVLVQRANDFLRSNPHLTVNTCESVEFRTPNGYSIETITSVYINYYEYPKYPKFIRGLRLWTQEKAHCKEYECEQIGYLNFVPLIGGAVGMEGLDTLVARVNRQITTDPIPGHVVTVETQAVKLDPTNMDPDRTILVERGTDRVVFINFIRIFYILGPEQHCQVGLHDFVPGVVQFAGDGHELKMETFETVMKGASQWLMSLPPNYRPVNIQTVILRWNTDEKIDTNRMDFHEEKHYHLTYLRYLRVSYVTEDPQEGPSARPLIQLHSKLIVPLMLKKAGTFEDHGDFETQDETRTRVNAWVRATGARVVSVESLVLRIYDGSGTHFRGYTDNYPMHVRNVFHKIKGITGRTDEKMIHLYRVYTDGENADPNDWRDANDFDSECVVIMELQHVPMISPALGLQSVDFLPEITGANGPSNRPEYESFFVLVQRANNFLRGNPHFTVNTCESVEFNVGNSGRKIDTLNSVYTAHGHTETRYIRALRLWMQTKSSPDGVCDQIGYGNFLPQIQGQGSTFSVETLDGVMARINHQFQQYPMPGRIITIETQPIKWGSSALDPDRTIWTERGSASTNFVNVIRIFFLQGPVQRCHVGVQDFLPGTLQTGLLLG
ncbi:uncharacterized protein LOC129587036 [Paramacrobiotus metropolitanus]|uniref:uncharacterized protein LOC129587036 n=1 Tax=Paramacrobiotus metropolitanus TaxID=2943436 RepID=UPI002446278C|nr:uncharacterized protein LOC129587036 [Paramacrobiotus metropolitanus]